LEFQARFYQDDGEILVSDSDELAIFDFSDLDVEPVLVPGILSSRNIPFETAERYTAYPRGNYTQILVPASRLADARRALEDAKGSGI